MTAVTKRASQIKTLVHLIRKYVLGSAVVRALLLPITIALACSAYGEILMAETLSQIQEDAERGEVDTAAQYITKYALLAIFSYTLSFIALFILSRHIENICRIFLLDLYAEHISMSYKDFNKIGIGEMISFMDRKTRSLSVILESAVKVFISMMLCIVLTVLAIFIKFGFRHLCIILGVLVLYAAAMLVINQYRNKARLELNKEVDMYRRRVFNGIMNHDIIKSYNNEEMEADELYLCMARQTFLAKIYWSMLAVSNFVGESIFAIITAALFIHYSNYTTKPTIDSMMFATYYSLFNNLRIYCVDICNSILLISFHLTNITQTRAEPPELDSPDTGQEKVDFNNAIEIVGMEVNIDGKTILGDVSATIRKGDKIAITGLNGSGKSSFVKVLLGLFDYRGSVKIDGMELSELRKTSLRNLIAYAPQDSLIFDETVMSNIKSGNPLASNEKILACCKEFEMHEVFCGFNDGYETSVGERGRRLSGGQKQRLNFMRAIVKDSPIFIFDQVTSSLDRDSEARLVDLVLSNLRDKTVLMILNNLEYLRKFNTVYYFSGGKLAGIGDPATLMKSIPDFAAYYANAN
jgi:ABC-type multidrug transport system fused ATPase/permease subunit